MLKNLMIGVLVAVFTALLTLVAAKADVPTRMEVQTMVSQSEQRTLIAINEIKADQKALLALQQTLLSKQGELSGQLEGIRRGQR